MRNDEYRFRNIKVPSIVVARGRRRRQLYILYVYYKDLQTIYYICYTIGVRQDKIAKISRSEQGWNDTLSVHDIVEPELRWKKDFIEALFIY